MTVTSKPFVSSKYAGAVEAVEYGPVPTGTRSIIDKCTGYNGTSAPVSLTIRIVPNAGTAGASNVTVVKSIAAGQTYLFPEIVGQPLAAGESVSVLAGAASSIVIRMGGREIT